MDFKIRGMKGLTLEHGTIAFKLIFSVVDHQIFLKSKLQILNLHYTLAKSFISNFRIDRMI